VTEKPGVLARSSGQAAPPSLRPPASADHPGHLDPDGCRPFAFEGVVDRICALNWEGLTRDDLVDVAWAYYYFSVQFRENLEIACTLYPQDEKLRRLGEEECHTANLSPWPGIAAAGEKLDHDEFMRRLLELSAIDDRKRHDIEHRGRSYLEKIRQMSLTTRATSIASYEDGGLERVFRAILRSRHWDSPLLQAFRHFLVEHIRFDNDLEQGHGTLSRHLPLSDKILPLWTEFHRILVDCAPRLAPDAK
jgi:hypothetical protein